MAESNLSTGCIPDKRRKCYRDPVQGFWARVRKTDSCWLWTGARNGRGYGVIHVGKRIESAHRFSYALHFGEFDQELFVCHHCDTPSCVRPDHLFLGTHQDNMDDMAAKGRVSDPRGESLAAWRYTNNGGVRGEQHGSAKLTEDNVRMARAMYSSKKKTAVRLASELGVSTFVVLSAIHRRTWSHVE